MKIYQQRISLSGKKRGFHLITNEVLRALPELANIKAGLCQVFIQHTSASLTINENADPTVRKDFETFFKFTEAQDFMTVGKGIPIIAVATLISFILANSIDLSHHELGALINLFWPPILGLLAVLVFFADMLDRKR